MPGAAVGSCLCVLEVVCSIPREPSFYFTFHSPTICSVSFNRHDLVFGLVVSSCLRSRTRISHEPFFPQTGAFARLNIKALVSFAVKNGLNADQLDLLRPAPDLILICKKMYRSHNCGTYMQLTRLNEILDGGRGGEGSAACYFFWRGRAGGMWVGLVAA